MTVNDQSVAEQSVVTAPETKTHAVELTDVAALKVKSLLEQEGRDDLRLRIAVQPAAVPVSCTSCTSTSARSTVTWFATSTASASSSTG